MKIFKLKAPAKINLTLEVVKKLSNGYHELRTVMLKLGNVFDDVEIEFYPGKKGIKIKTDSKNIPTNKRNICWKAVERYLKKINKEIGIVIKIKKRIPVEAGLGGGSSDGAAVLKILNSYFKNKVSKVELQKLASEIGKDVPVFLSSKDAVFLDRMGDRIRKEVGFRKFNFLLVNPGIYVSTPWAFNEIHKCGNLGNKKKSVRMLKYLEKKNFGAIISELHNDFEMAMEKKYPIISELKKKLIEFGASGSLMSGSGSTVFGIFENQKKLLEAEKMMKKNYPKFFVKIG